MACPKQIKIIENFSIWWPINVDVENASINNYEDDEVEVDFANDEDKIVWHLAICNIVKFM